MIGRIIFTALAVAAPPAFSQELGGTWQFSTGDLQPANGCILSGALVLQGQGKPETLSCELAARYQCRKGKDGKLVVKEPCVVETRGKDIFIRGTSYEFVEVDPPGWIDKYYLDTFTLRISRDGRQMAGRIGTRTTAMFERIRDLAK